MSPPEAEDWIRPISTDDLQRQMEERRLTIEQRRAIEQQARQSIEQQMLLASEQQRRYEQQQWRDAYEQQPIGPAQAEYSRQLQQEAQRQAQRQYELEARQQAYERGLVNYGQFIYAQPLTEGSPPPPFSELGRSSLERLGMSPSPPPPTPTKDDPLGQGAGTVLLPDQEPVSDRLLEYIERVAENKGRVKATKITDGLTPDERKKEQARQKIAKALNEAVAVGYLTEARAVSMIAAGGLNDRPMQPEGALDQVVACLAQGGAGWGPGSRHRRHDRGDDRSGRACTGRDAASQPATGAGGVADGADRAARRPDLRGPDHPSLPPGCARGSSSHIGMGL